MPWRNIPKAKWPQMERCVNDLKDQGHSEDSANAICYTSIMGHKKASLPSQITFNLNLNDYWKNRMEELEEEKEEETGLEKIEISNKSESNREGGDKMSKQEEVLKAMDPKMKACVTGHMDEGKSMKEAQSMCQKEMAADKVAKDDEEAVEETVESVETSEGVVEEKAEEAVEEAVAEEKEEEAVAEAEEEVAEEAVVDAKEEVVAADPVGDLLKQVLTKVSEIEASLQKEDSASAEGVAEAAEAVEEAAPEVSASDAAVEEASAPESESADVSSEETDKVAKVDDSLTKIADSLEKITKGLTDLEARINKLEEQPVPSKIVSPKVVAKGEDLMVDTLNQARLTEIKSELDKLEDMRNKDTERYQKERLWEKAFDLITERDRLSKV